MLSYILPFIILILVVVFIHEYGHYYFAKKYGVGITDFSIGFGREIIGWNDKSGTRWKICWIPLGGYVKFFGDRNVFSQADHEELLKKYNQEDQKKIVCYKTFVSKIFNCSSWASCKLFISNFNFYIYLYAFWKRFHTSANK